ncbi:MAG: amidohydrolase [Sphingomonadales bacterium]|nr:MAG: amidohydrolase [Sphingomonadales bacterium]
MKIVALEDHYVPAELFAAWAEQPEDQRDLSYAQSSVGEVRRRLEDLEGERLREMDRAGIDVQVLSLTTPGLQSLCEPQAIAMSRRINDLTAAAIRRRPDRFQGFATLPLATAEPAVAELRRAVVELGLNGAMVYGRLGERNMDDRLFWPVYEEAARLRVPLYVHPQSPPAAVRQAYYSGLSSKLDQSFASGGIGWHYEAGVQLLRLILAGVLDEYPDLQLITGHWGEVVLFYLDRVDQIGETGEGPKRPISDYWRSNIHVTPSGIFSQRYLEWTIKILGAERIMWSTDYPYRIAGEGEARRFLETAPIGEDAKLAIGSGNWERLVTRIRRG